MNELKQRIKDKAIKGQVIFPEDQEYDQARIVVPGGIDNHPAVIVRVKDSEDIAHILQLAREMHREISVKSGGHGNAGYAVCGGGIVIDLSLLKQLDINPTGKYAWAETGLTTGEYTKAVGAYNLVTGFGDTGSVGIGGITLGGGIGYLSRKYGLTIDDVLGMDIVTADGKFLRADFEHHPNLFWALRGGGGNFGVVTRIKFRLHALDMITGGMLILPATPETITSFVHKASIADDNLTTILNIMTAPPLPFLPKEYHGKIILMAMMCFAGDEKQGEKVMKKFRSIAPPIADMVKRIPYPDMFPPTDLTYHPLSSTRTMFIDKIQSDTATILLEKLRASIGSMSVAQVRVLGGAVHRIPKDETAFAHRHSEIMINLATLYQEMTEKVSHELWVSDFERSIHQTDTGAYVNFLGNEGIERVQAAYPGKTWDRLVTVKTHYDPNNVFHYCQNIPPSIV